MDEEHINAVDRLIILAFKKNKRPLSTYQVAKKANLSWSTANTHCYKLKSLGMVDMKRERNHFGQIKVMWKLSDKKQG